MPEPRSFPISIFVRWLCRLDDPARENWHHYSHKIARLSLEGVGIALARCDFSLIFAAKNLPIWKGGEITMDLLKRLYVEEDGQGLVFWVAIKNTNVGNQLASGWSKVTSCVGDPSACDVSS